MTDVGSPNAEYREQRLDAQRGGDGVAEQHRGLLFYEVGTPQRSRAEQASDGRSSEQRICQRLERTPG